MNFAQAPESMEQITTVVSVPVPAIINLEADDCIQTTGKTQCWWGCCTRFKTCVFEGVTDYFGSWAAAPSTEIAAAVTASR